MNTMNSVNTCPYCTGLHGELGRMAGINSYAIVEGGAGEAAKQVSSPAIAYTKAFAEGCGRGPAVESTRAACVAAMGEGKTKSVEACCWYLQWGKTTGNTVNKVRNALFKPWTLYKVSLGELATFVYYTPLFIVVGVFNALLKIFPRVPQWFSAAIGFVLWSLIGLHIVPLAACSAPPSPSRRCRSPTSPRAERVSDASSSPSFRLFSVSPLSERTPHHRHPAGSGICRSRFAAYTGIIYPCARPTWARRSAPRKQPRAAAEERGGGVLTADGGDKTAPITKMRTMKTMTKPAPVEQLGVGVAIVLASP